MIVRIQLASYVPSSVVLHSVNLINKPAFSLSGDPDVEEREKVN